jgi:hypothetical protein
MPVFSRDLFSIAAVALLASQASAVIATTSTTTPNPEDTFYQFVGQMNGASAVAIGPHTVLTAAHVGGNAGNFILDGTTYTRIGSKKAPSYLISPGNSTNVDLMVVYVSQTLPGYYSLGNSISGGDTVTMVGFGKSGFVSGTNYSVSIPAGTRRKGDNTADVFGVIDVDNATGNSGAGGGPVIGSYLKVAGDAVLGSMDSGGGWFSGGNLVGISSFTFNESQSGTETSPTYGDYGFASKNTNGYTAQDGSYTLLPGQAYFGSGAIDLTDPQIHDFVVQSVPEPAPMAALGLGLLAVLRKRRK